MSLRGEGRLGEFTRVESQRPFRDGHHGLDRRAAVGDVAHVGGTHRAGAGRAGKPLRLEHFLHQGLGCRVRAHVVEALQVLCPLHGCSRGDCGPTGAVENLGHQLVQPALLRGPHLHPAGRPVRYHVHRGTAVRDDAVHAGFRPGLLPQHVHRHQEKLGPVQGVPPVPRCRRGMGRFAPEGDVVAVQGQGTVIRPGGSPGCVHHHRQVDPVEDPRVRHGTLGPVGLLGRGAHHPGFPARFLHRLPQCEPGIKGKCSVQAVPAGMPDLRKGVVFRQEGHHPSFPAALLRHEGCLDAQEGKLDLEPVFPQDFDKPPAAFEFFCREFRVMAEKIAEGRHLAGPFVEETLRSLLQFLHRRHDTPPFPGL